MTDTVEVQSSSVRLHGVFQVDLDHISPVGNDGWARILIVNEKTGSSPAAVRITGSIRDLEVVDPSFACCWPFGVEIGANAEAISPARTSESTVRAPAISNFGCGYRHCR